MADRSLHDRRQRRHFSSGTGRPEAEELGVHPTAWIAHANQPVFGRTSPTERQPA